MVADSLELLTCSREKRHRSDHLERLGHPFCLVVCTCTKTCHTHAGFRRLRLCELRMLFDI